MNRKLVNALLLAALATGASSVFTSCKDTDEDFNNYIIGNQVKLENDLKALDARVAAIEADYAKKSYVDDTFVKKDELDGAIEDYLEKLGLKEGDKLVTTSNLKGLVDDIIAEYLKAHPITGTPGPQGPAGEPGKDGADGKDGQDGKDGVDGKDGQDGKDGVDGKDGQDGKDYDPEVLKNYVELKIYQAKIAALSNLIAENKIAAAQAQSYVEALENQVNYFLSAINDRIDNLITDIILNQTWNPIFGSINLPVGLATTITANYYGVSTADLEFPFNQNHQTVTNSGIADITADVFNGLNDGLQKFEVKEGVTYMNDENGVGTLGKLYLSLNPAEIDAASGKINYSLVNSKGEAAPVEKIELAKYDEALKFGITRSEGNVYVAPIKVTAENAPALAIPVESGLKSAMKDALKDHTKADLVALAKVLVNQMKDLGPAYALKATWETKTTDPSKVTSSNGSVTVQDSINLSQTNYGFDLPTGTKTNTYIGKYEIAASTLHPLGYNFMEGMGADKDVLPTIGSIKEAVDKVLDDMKSKIVINTGVTGFEWKEVNLEFKDVTFDPTEIVISLEGLKVGEGEDAQDVTFADGSQKIVLGYNPDGTVDTNETALNGLIESIAEAINTQLGDETNPDSLMAQIKNNLISQVNDMCDSINEQLAGIDAAISGSINTSINNIKDMLAGKLGRLDSFINKYNSLAERINKVLKNPNHYLQVAMLYEDANGAYHQLSDNVNAPTRVKAGSGALDLLATSLTGEIIAPSCKKYVAVGRVWNGKTPVAYADAAKDLNSTEFINEVASGNQIQFSLDGSKMKKGYKYEIIYSSLDFNGYTSTRTFYVVVI